MRGRNSYVALVGDQMAGFSDMSSDGHIEMLFVSPRFAGQGVAGKLLKFLEQQAQGSSARQLTAEVSITARPFFEACGFDGEAEQLPMVQAVPLTNIRITKKEYRPAYHPTSHR